VQNQTQLSPLNQISGLIAALGGQSGTTGILGQLGITNGLQGLLGSIGSSFGSSGSNPSFDITTDWGNVVNQPISTPTIDTSGGNGGAPADLNNFYG
jgi:hypothetical protein